MQSIIRNHSAADLFPEMAPEEFAALKADIQQHGQREPIVAYDEFSYGPATVIIDGRHRFRACSELGIEPVVKTWQGNMSDIPALVLSLNLHRRHLTTSQRAIIAAKLANLEHGGDRKSEEIKGTIVPMMSRSQAAEVLSVNEKTVDRAAAVIREGTPEQVNAIESGSSTVNAELQKIRPFLAPTPFATVDHPSIKQQISEDPECKKIDREHFIQGCIGKALDLYATTEIKDYNEAVSIYFAWNEDWTPEECVYRAQQSVEHLNKIIKAFMDSKRLKVVK